MRHWAILPRSWDLKIMTRDLNEQINMKIMTKNHLDNMKMALKILFYSYQWTLWHLVCCSSQWTIHYYTLLLLPRRHRNVDVQSLSSLCNELPVPAGPKMVQGDPIPEPPIDSPRSLFLKWVLKKYNIRYDWNIELLPKTRGFHTKKKLVECSFSDSLVYFFTVCDIWQTLSSHLSH